MNKKNIVILTIFIITFTILGITKLDLVISNFFYKPDSYFGLFFKHFGSLGSHLLLLIAFLSLYDKTNKKYYLLFALIDIVVYVYRVSNYLDITLNLFLLYLIYLIIGLILLLLILFIKKYYNIKLEKHHKIAIFFILFVIIELVIVNLLKITFGRPRYYLFEEFKHWYELNPFQFTNAYKSFPSGHTGDAALLLGLTLISEKQYTKVLVWIYILCMALSRIILGAHYLSDVLMSIFIVYFIFKLLQNKSYK